jgi:hypothetical protein
MTNKIYDIGEQASFNHRGELRTGRVFGVEFVEDGRRRRGWHYVLHAGPLELIHVHESQMQGRSEPVAVPISDDDAWGVLR